MKKNTILVISVALAAAFCGSNARAQDHANELERTAEDVINEARARLEGQRSPSSQKKQRVWEPPKFYFGFTTERSDLNLRSIVRPIQAEQRDATSLVYLAPVENQAANDTNGSSDALVAGVRLSNRLALELVRRETDDTFHVTSATAPVLDPTLPAPVSVPRRQRHEGLQWSTLEYGAWELSILPRWRLSNKGLNQLLTLYGRVGIGYAQTDVSTVTESQLQEVRPVRCSTEQAFSGCNGSPYWEPIEVHSWNDHHQKDGGVFPVLGVGIELSPFFHVEYQLRASIPIAGRTTNIRTLTLQLSF
jgi:hypothetical protein